MALTISCCACPGCGAGVAAPQRADAPRPTWRSCEQRGLAIQLASGRDAIETYLPLLHEIAALGANTVLLSVSGHMEHAKSQSIFVDARLTPTPDDLAAIVQEARALGLRTIVMPVVLLRRPRGSEWRGVIEPPDWKEWWRDYEDFVGHYADVAAAARADALIVGSELVSTEQYTERWLAVIAETRRRFGGRLGYSANWDHYKPIGFWDRLDFIGMTTYYTLADEAGASVEAIVARWTPHKRDITEFARCEGKPLIFTEVGWCSQAGAATAPWNYYKNMKATPDGHEEQRRLYEAFLRVWDGAPELAGVIWWEWPPGAGGAGDFGYTPKNKPAEQVLRRWFAAPRPAAPVGSP